MSNSEKNITRIELRKMRMNGLELDEQALIHREQLDKVCEIIEHKLNDAKKYDPEKEFISINDVISIFARRGAGKTTFVKSLIKLAKTGKLERKGISCEDLMCIDVIEPNQIHRKEIFLVRFLASIQEKFEEETKCEKKEDGYLRKYKEELYEALPVIDGIGKMSLYSDWDDSDYLADMYIQLAMKAKDLEKRFHRYIHKILELSNKKALLFVLDDTDVNIEKSFDILETIRLFFTSPEIIVIMTGDISLYGMAIRKKYWKFFDNEFIEKDSLTTLSDTLKKKEYYDMVRQLEAQYLQKMTKAEHRIVLNTVYDKYKKTRDYKVNEKYSIDVTFSSKEGESEKEGKDLLAIYREILEKVEVITSSSISGDAQIFINQLLTQPFRNQFRLLSVYDEYLLTHDEEDSINNVVDLAECILKVFEVYVNQSSPDSKKLMGRSPIYSGYLAKFLIDNEIIETSSHLLPNTGNDTLDNTLFALCIWCEGLIYEDKSIAFDFLVRVSFIRQIINVLNEGGGKYLEKHLNLCRDIEAHKLLGITLAYFNARHRVTPTIMNGKEYIQYPFAGIFIIKEPFQSKKGVEENLINLIQFSIQSSNASKTYMCSFYNLIACIAELLREKENRKLYQNQKASEWLAIKLHEISQFLTYIEPNKNRDSFIDRQITNKRTVSNLKPSPSDDTFLESLNEWLEDVESAKITPQSLDRIFTRTYYTFTYIDYGGGSENMGQTRIGYRFNNYVLAFWNACLVEECIINGSTKGISLDNNADIGTIFKKNYTQYMNIKENEYVEKVEKAGKSQKQKEHERYEKSQKESFLQTMIRCPILRAYVNPNELQTISNANTTFREKHEKFKVKKEKENSHNMDNSKELSVYNDLL